MAEETPEPDRLDGAPHPRDTARLFGQAEAEAELLAAFTSGRMHHAWLLTGPRGVGKATLAWRTARFLLAAPEPGGGLFGPPAPDSLDVPDSDPVARRMRAQAEPRLFHLRRVLREKSDRLQDVITIDEVRRMKSFFALSEADGKSRVAVIDCADELNTPAANALLKLLEEPPAKVTFLVVAHQPSRLLPTIRSRCRVLRLPPLGPRDLAAALAAAGGEVTEATAPALAELADGSVGEAFRLTNLDGLALYQGLVDLLAGLPRMDRPRALALAEAGAARGAEARFDLTVTLTERLLSRLARRGTLGTDLPEAARGEAALLARLAPGPGPARGWADLAQGLAIRARRGRAVNLDPAALLMDMLLRIDETAGTLAQT
jgi:DNA polymerase-3 subunit delta'